MKLSELNGPLDIGYIDFRVQSINKGGYATILAYKDARVDMNRLDAICGPDGWQRDHKELKGNIYCGVGIKCGGEWVWKWDCGSESFTEKEKGESSDSFKRACFNWGIGRELYSYPVIKVKLNQDEFTLQNDKARQTWNLKLREWKWTLKSSDNKVERLEAIDEKGISRFKFQLSKNTKIPNNLDIAKAEAVGCKTIKSLEDTWNAYTELHTNEQFKNHIKSLKLKL